MSFKILSSKYLEINIRYIITLSLLQKTYISDLFLYRTFKKGGNYGDKEAENAINELVLLRNKVSEMLHCIMMMLTKKNYKSITKVKENLSMTMNP